MSQREIHDLVEMLEQASDAYYNADPIMADVEFDALLDELRQLDPGNALLKRVGSKAKATKFKKVPHGAPMGSLEKVQTPDEFDKWTDDMDAKLDAAEKDGDLEGVSRALVVSEKLDGISCFSAETEVVLANGERVPIADLVERGEPLMVMSWDPEEGVSERRAVAFHDNGMRDDWVRLTFEDGTQIVVTADHKFYIEGEGWCEAAQLLGKDVLDCEEG